MESDSGRKGSPGGSPQAGPGAGLSGDQGPAPDDTRLRTQACGDVPWGRFGPASVAALFTEGSM